MVKSQGVIALLVKIVVGVLSLRLLSPWTGDEYQLLPCLNI